VLFSGEKGGSYVSIFALLKLSGKGKKLPCQGGQTRRRGTEIHQKVKKGGGGKARLWGEVSLGGTKEVSLRRVGLEGLTPEEGKKGKKRKADPRSVLEKKRQRLSLRTGGGREVRNHGLGKTFNVAKKGNVSIIRVEFAKFVTDNKKDGNEYFG